eukprot:c11525_g1_i1.p1 GENE.c11525_g1_i1~~c11525_g1_i1.p1  ORF type:complete len:806 (-),score=183.58 c11525_g1_i1:74-2326(-)
MSVFVSTSATEDKKAPPWTSPCDKGKPLYQSRVCNTAESIDARVHDLLKRLPNEAKASLLANAAQGVASLAVPAYEWWNEALHGVGHSPGVSFGAQTPSATSFPQVISTACSFNTTLFRMIGEAVGTEARAFHNLGRAGLTMWAPNINIFRDPRWGRGQETPGEDPYLTSDYAASFPLGLQSGEAYPRYLKVSACCKHFAAYSFEDWGGVDRHHFNAVVSPQDMADTYLPAFQSCVQRAKVSGFMCSYNAINGVPACARYDLLTTKLRHEWGFDGYVVSDCAAVDDLFWNHKYSPSPVDACAATLSAGMDIDCGNFLSGNVDDCVKQGKCNISQVDTAITHLLKVQIRLGMFNPTSKKPYANLGASHINSRAHQNLALEAARQAIVLLKNNNHRLPLKHAKLRIGLIGPHYDAYGALLGNYYGDAPFITSPFQAISSRAPSVGFAQGCDLQCKDRNNFHEAVTIAKNSDVSVVFVGLDNSIEGEGHDRSSIALPGHQVGLIKTVCEASHNPIVVVVMASGSVDLSFAKSSDCVGAILWTGYLGQSGGEAIANVLFGEVNPAGRLTQTLYLEEYAKKVSMFDMGMRPNITTGNPGRTHRFYTGSPVYRFGSGLSYSAFKYSWQTGQDPSFKLSLATLRKKISASVTTLESGLETVLSLPLRVCNSKEMDGDHVLLVFASPPQAGKRGIPEQSLAAYTRVHVKKSLCNDVHLNVPARAFAFADNSGTSTTQIGLWKLRIGQPAQLSLTVQVM